MDGIARGIEPAYIQPTVCREDTAMDRSTLSITRRRAVQGVAAAVALPGLARAS